MKRNIFHILSVVLLTVFTVQCKPEPIPVIPDQPELPEHVDVGITTEPAELDADKPCLVHFRPSKESELYGCTSDLYVHIGLYADEDWEFVQAEWNQNKEKCKMKKVGENHWTLELGPTIRDYFGSGETPVVSIAMVVRNSDGSRQTRPDCFIPVKDNKYQYAGFVPDPVEKASKPAGTHYGINYNPDNSVTFVLLEEDKQGKSYDYCYLIGEFSDWERKSEYAMKRDEKAHCWWYTMPASKIEPGKEYLFQYHIGNQKEHFRLTDPYTEIVYDPWDDQWISSSTYPGLTPYPEKTKDRVAAFQVDRPAYEWKNGDYQIEDENDLIIYELLLRDFSATKDLNGALERLDYLDQLGINAIELMPIQEFDGNRSWGYNPNHYFALDKAYGTRDMYKKFIDECHGRGIAVIVDVVYNHATGGHPMARLYWDGKQTAERNPWFNVEAPHKWSVFHDWNHTEPMTRDHIRRSLEYLIKEYKVDGFRFDLSKGFTQNSGTEESYDQSRVDILTEYADFVEKVDPNAVVILEHLVDAENEALSKAGMKLWRNCNGIFKNTGKGQNEDLSYLRTRGNEAFGSAVGYMESHDEERVAYVQKLAFGEGTSDVRWGICGTITDWGKKTDISLLPEKNLLVAKGVRLTTSDAFKIRGNNEWNDAFNCGGKTKGEKIPFNQAYALVNGSSSQDMAVAKDGSYDIYFHPGTKKMWIMNNGKAPEFKDETQDSALTRMMRHGALNAAFFLTVPGPKMIWQFGEMGYDISIEEGGRVSEKPLHWDYLDVPERKALHDVYAGLLRFRTENPRFFDSDADFRWSVDRSHFPGKFIFAEVGGKRFTVVGNFSDAAQTISVDLPADGTWYNWFDRKETFTGTHHEFKMKDGEFKLLVNF